MNRRRSLTVSTGSKRAVEKADVSLNGMREGPYVVACIPAYNEELTIGVVAQAMNYVERVVICDDGSEDLTGAIAGGLGAAVVRHERNMGYGFTVLSLFRAVRSL